MGLFLYIVGVVWSLQHPSNEARNILVATISLFNMVYKHVLGFRVSPSS